MFDHFTNIRRYKVICIWDSVKHLWWSTFANIVIGKKPLPIFKKKLHNSCLVGNKENMLKVKYVEVCEICWKLATKTSKERHGCISHIWANYASYFSIPDVNFEHVIARWDVFWHLQEEIQIGQKRGKETMITKNRKSLLEAMRRLR